MKTEKVNAVEFISRMAATLVANAVITAGGNELTEKHLPNWAVLPRNRCCSPATYVAVEPFRWWQRTTTAVYGTANGPKVAAKLTRKEAKIVSEIIAEAETAAEMVMRNPWSVMDL